MPRAQEPHLNSIKLFEEFIALESRVKWSINLSFKSARAVEADRAFHFGF
jgi:hypothetical protein